MTSVSVAVEPPSLAVMDTAFVDAGCAGKETRHAPSARACAEASATVSVSALTTETVTLAPGAAQPQTEAACEGGGGSSAGYYILSSRLQLPKKGNARGAIRLWPHVGRALKDHAVAVDVGKGKRLAIGHGCGKCEHERAEHGEGGGAQRR